MKHKKLKDLILQIAQRLNLTCNVKNYGLESVVKNVYKKLDSEIFSSIDSIIEDEILELSF